MGQVHYRTVESCSYKIRDMIKIDIHDDGEHWHKTVKVFGITVYHRHDYTKNNGPRPIGFNPMAQIPGEIEEDDDWTDKRK